MISKIITKADNYFDEVVSFSGIAVTHNDILKGIANTGNLSAIAEVLKKAINKEKITICFFGGSITAGASATTPPLPESGIDIKLPKEENIYCNRIANWFRDIFGCEVDMYNAGIGATDTQLATHRLTEDVLCYKPDLVINEWAMNDNPSMSQKWKTYESVVRKLLEEDIAVLLYSFCGTAGNTAQEVHIPVAVFYDLPMLSYKDAFFSHEKFLYFSNDKVHPNQLGHPMAALQICDFLTDVLKNLNNISTFKPTIPKTTYHPLADTYNGAYVARFKDIEDGLHNGIRIIDRGSFEPESELRHHGKRELTPFTAAYSENYKPMIIEVDSAKSVHLLNYKRKCLDDGSYMLKINGKEIVDESLNYACGHSFDYVWASDRVYYCEEAEKLSIEIIPTCKNQEDFVSIFALLLV